MNVELVPMPEDRAFWSVVIAVGIFVILLLLRVQDEDLKKTQRLFAFLTGLFAFGVGSLWVLSNYVFVP